MSDLPERILAWPSGRNHQRVTLAGGRTDQMVEYIRKDIADAAVAAALEANGDIVKAWESLPGGQHSVNVVEQWLLRDMKPAIDAIRAAVQVNK